MLHLNGQAKPSVNSQILVVIAARDQTYPISPIESHSANSFQPLPNTMSTCQHCLSLSLQRDSIFVTPMYWLKDV